MKYLSVFILFFSLQNHSHACLDAPFQVGEVPQTSFGQGNFRVEKVDIQFSDGEKKLFPAIISDTGSSGKLMFYSEKHKQWCFAAMKTKNGYHQSDCQIRKPNKENRSSHSLLLNSSGQAIGYLVLDHEDRRVNIFSMKKLVYSKEETQDFNKVLEYGIPPVKNLEKPAFAFVEQSSAKDFVVSAIAYNPKTGEPLKSGKQPLYARTYRSIGMKLRSVATTVNSESLGCASAADYDTMTTGKSALEGNMAKRQPASHRKSKK